MSERETTPGAREGAADGAQGETAAARGGADTGAQAVAGGGAQDAAVGGAQGASAVGGAARDLDAAQARLAYSIIGALLEHTRVTGDLVALMAQAMDEDTLKALTGTPHWDAYLDSRRAMERTREEIERFTEIMTALGGESESG